MTGEPVILPFRDPREPPPRRIGYLSPEALRWALSGGLGIEIVQIGSRWRAATCSPERAAEGPAEMPGSA